MKQIHSDIIQFRGTHFDFGKFQGEKLKDSLTVRNRENQWKVRKPRFVIDEQEAEAAIKRFAPYVWEEILGLQEALQWPMESVLREFGGYRVPYGKSGCSIMTGHDYLIRNYDYHPKTYEGRYMLFQPSDGGYAMIGPSQRTTGRMDGMNECGLAIGYNFMHRKNPGPGFICCMIGRLLLESCRNVAEAVAMLKEIPHRNSFSYVLHDASGMTKIVEASPRGIKVREDHACTNHFEIQVEENRNHLGDSKRRLSILKEHPGLEAREAFRLMNDRDKGVFSDLYGSWAGTIHTSAYFPKEGKAWFVLGGDKEPVEFNFSAWLEGKEIAAERIEGEVDTEIPFLHMDEGADWFKR